MNLKAQEFLTLVNIILILCCGCKRKELPVPAFDRGNVTTVQVEMFPDYRNQVWYSLSANAVIKTNLKTDWDLAFESSSEGFHILLNTSKAMRAYKTNFTSLDDISDTSGYYAGGKADVPSGNYDSSAFAGWNETKTCYIVSRGYNEKGKFLGFWKLFISSCNNSAFTFEYGDVFSKKTFQGTITKDNRYNFNAYSFTSHAQVQIEPEKNTYDLCFTQFTTLFYDPFQYYQVTGVLTDNSGTKIIKTATKPFGQVTINDTVMPAFSTRMDAIGYDWKTFDLGTNIYTVNDRITYIIKDAKGFYYKMHFIDFYNDKGEKGYPEFEYVKL